VHPRRVILRKGSGGVRSGVRWGRVIGAPQGAESRTGE
jgi:hypothetical protein